MERTSLEWFVGRTQAGIDCGIAPDAGTGWVPAVRQAPPEANQLPTPLLLLLVAFWTS